MAVDNRESTASKKRGANRRSALAPEHGRDRAAAAAERVAPDQLLFFGDLTEQGIEALRQGMLLQVEIRFVLNGQRVVCVQHLLVLPIEPELLEMTLHDRQIALPQRGFGLPSEVVRRCGFMTAHDAERVADRHCADRIDENRLRLCRGLLGALVHERFDAIDLTAQTEVAQTACNRLHLLRQPDSVHGMIAVAAWLRQQIRSANAAELERFFHRACERGLTLRSRGHTAVLQDLRHLGAAREPERDDDDLHAKEKCRTELGHGDPPSDEVAVYLLRRPGSRAAL